MLKGRSRWKLFYMTTVVCHFPPLLGVWVVEWVGYVNVKNKPAGSANTQQSYTKITFYFCSYTLTCRYFCHFVLYLRRNYSLAFWRWKEFLCQILPHIQTNICFTDRSEAFPIFLLISTVFRSIWLRTISRMALTRESRSTGRKRLSQCQFVHPISHMNWYGIEAGPQRSKPFTCIIR
jgi:hypothetical protein